MPSNPWISLAPIQGITDAIYRKVFRDFFPGVDCYYAPFIKVQKDSKQHKGLRSRIPAHNEAVPLVLQILSNDPDEFPVLDEELWKSGYQEFNWNLGCPVSMVAKKRRGSGLLPHADKIQAILESVMPRLHCRLSIKLRLGMNDPNEILALIPIFNQFPIKELIIHPRLGKQLYRGQVDLGKFEECLSLSRLPVVYNGDIFNQETFDTLQKRFPQVNRWMLGRGILVNPFLPAQIKGLADPVGDKMERIQKFHDAYVTRLSHELSGPAHIVDKLKGFWTYTHFLFEQGPAFFKKMIKTKHYEAYSALVEQFFSQKPVVLENVHIKSDDFQ